MCLCVRDLKVRVKGTSGAIFMGGGQMCHETGGVLVMAIHIKLY